MQTLTETLNRAVLTPQHHYSDRYDQVRARLTMFLSLFMMVATVLLMIVRLAGPGTPYLNSELLAYTIAFLIGLTSYLLAANGRLRLAGLVVLVPLTVAVLLPKPPDLNLLILPLPVIYASVMFRWWGLLVTVSVDFIVLMATAYSQVSSGAATSVLYSATALNIVILAVFGVFIGTIVYELQAGFRLVGRLLAQLRATSEIAQTTITAASREDLLARVANYIRDRFGFYEVQIFLIETEHRFANLAAATNQEGQEMQKRGYRVAIGASSVVGQVALLGEALNVTRGESDPTPLSETSQRIRSEIGLPLIVGDEILGVLDVQSALPRAFSAEDVESLKIIATQVSIGIRNAQLFEEQKTALNENRRLFLEAEINLREMQRLNQRLTGQAWDDYLKAQHVGTIGYSITNNQLRSDSVWTDTLSQAASTRRPVIITTGNRQIVAVPVELRGKPVGAIEVEIDTMLRQTETLDMLQSVAQRLALSIDNARLFEQAQELAQQELEVNTIATHLQGITSMDEIIKATVDELSRALGAEYASIRLGAVEAGANGSSGQ